MDKALLSDRLEQCIKNEISFRDSSERNNEKIEKNMLEEMLILLQIGNYDEARHLWRRLPATLSVSPLFQHLWQIVLAMMTHDSTLAFSLLSMEQQMQLYKGENEDETELDFIAQECNKLKEIYRVRVENSLTKCYRKLHVKNAMKLLGIMDSNEVIDYLTKWGWKSCSKESKDDIFLVPPSPSERKTILDKLESTQDRDINDENERAMKKGDLESKLQTLTDMAIFLEKKRLTV